jgi:hypothetical protein
MHNWKFYEYLTDKNERERTITTLITNRTVDIVD